MSPGSSFQRFLTAQRVLWDSYYFWRGAAQGGSAPGTTPVKCLAPPRQSDNVSGFVLCRSCRLRVGRCRGPVLPGGQVAPTQPAAWFPPEAFACSSLNPWASMPDPESRPGAHAAWCSEQIDVSLLLTALTGDCVPSAPSDQKSSPRCGDDMGEPSPAAIACLAWLSGFGDLILRGRPGLSSPGRCSPSTHCNKRFGLPPACAIPPYS